MMLILFSVAFAAIVAAGEIWSYKERVRQINRYYDDLIRESRRHQNAILDAAWRAQLDREQLFRDYVRQEGLQ